MTLTHNEQALWRVYFDHLLMGTADRLTVKEAAQQADEAIMAIRERTQAKGTRDIAVSGGL